MLALDNCEALIDKTGEEFRNLMSIFCDRSKLLKIIVISRNELGSTTGEQIQPLILPQLCSKQAVQFFLDVLSEEKRMQISTKELVELILAYPNYDFNKALPNKGLIFPERINDNFTDNFKEEFSKLV